MLGIYFSIYYRGSVFSGHSVYIASTFTLK